MPVYATRKFRNMATTLILLSGLTHVAQLWFVKLDGATILTALLGMSYLLIGLGLSGQSRFTLWLATCIPSAAAAAEITGLSSTTPGLLLLWHTSANISVALLCAYILYRTRHAEMD
jgi:hypothetical protein